MATIDAAMAHHGTSWPAVKYWRVVFCRRAKTNPAPTTAAR
ncbi:MAG TPA: hypothetical protein VF266_10850 [Thermoanaerobaculia bacterium]